MCERPNAPRTAPALLACLGCCARARALVMPLTLRDDDRCPTVAGPAVCNAAFTGQLQVLRRLHWAKANLNATDPYTPP